MKTAKIIFLGTCLFLLLWPVYRIQSFNRTFKQDGQSAAFLEVERRKFTDTIVANGPIVEKRIRLGYIKDLWTSAGVHLIHDPSMDMDAIIRAPENVLPYFSTGNGLGNYGFRFQRPIILDEDVEVRLNLNKHHPGILHIGFNSYGPTGRRARFTTLGPIVAKAVSLRGCPDSDQPIQVEAAFFDQGDSCNDFIVAGNIDQQSLSFGDRDRDYSYLQIKQANFSHNFPRGSRAAVNADTINIYYNFEYHDREDALDLLADDVPDTLYTSNQSYVNLNFRHDDRLEGLDTALLVIRPIEEF